MNTKPKLIILDGGRGAGKSTVSALLKEKSENTAFVDLDSVRHLIAKSKAADDFNAIAFGAIFAMTDYFISAGINVVIDSGVSQERIDKLNDITKKYNADIFLYHLSAPKDILWERIQKRGEERKRMPNRERFDYTLEINQSKSFSKFFKIDTTKHSSKEIADQIYKAVFLL